MKLGSQVIKMLNEIKVGRSQVVLDCGCCHGTYTTPAAKVVGEQGERSFPRYLLTRIGTLKRE